MSRLERYVHVLTGTCVTCTYYVCGGHWRDPEYGHCGHFDCPVKHWADKCSNFIRQRRRA